MSETTTAPPQDPYALYADNAPFNPSFMREAVRAMFRTLPLDPGEPDGWSHRRMHAALLALSALHPRDEIEVMLGVQAMSAYHAAAACFRIGMNLRRPNGDSTRHITAACSAARAFDTMLRALERRQAKPLAIPVGRPPLATGTTPPTRQRSSPALEEAAARRRTPRPTRPAGTPTRTGRPKTSKSPTPSSKNSGSKRKTRASTSPTPRASCPAAA